jgi:uncharacterized membrane protein YiaA
LTNRQREWYDKVGLLGFMTLVLPLIALVGLWQNTTLPKNFKILLGIAAAVNFLGQMAIMVQYLFS